MKIDRYDKIFKNFVVSRNNIIFTLGKSVICIRME